MGGKQSGPVGGSLWLASHDQQPLSPRDQVTKCLTHLSLILEILHQRCGCGSFLEFNSVALRIWVWQILRFEHQRCGCGRYLELNTKDVDADNVGNLTIKMRMQQILGI